MSSGKFSGWGRRDFFQAAEHAILIANRACRAALGDRGVAHLAIGKDVQMMKLSADKRSMRNPGARSSSSWSPPLSAPPPDQLRAAAEVLNAGSRGAVLAGQGALSARGSYPACRRPWRTRGQGAVRQGGLA